MRSVARRILRSPARLALALGAGIALSTPVAAQLLVVSQDNAKVLEYEPRRRGALRHEYRQR
jgi:hypothetical protein